MNVSAQRSDDGFVYVKCPKPGCGTGLRIQPKIAHSTVSCAKCGTKFTLDVADKVTAMPPALPIPKKASPPERNPLDLTNGDEDNRPIRLPSKRASGPPIGLIIGGGAVAILSLGGIVAAFIVILGDKGQSNSPDDALVDNSTKAPVSVTTTSERPPEKASQELPKSVSSSRIRPKKNGPAPKGIRPKDDPDSDPLPDPSEVNPAKSADPKPKETTSPGDAKEIIERVKKSTALIEAKGGWGTGFVIKPGIIMTNAHVISGRMIEDFRVSFVSLSDTAPPPLKATLLYSDKRRDLAILRVDTDRPPLAMTSPGTNLSGMEVAVVGNPKGDAGQAEVNKVTTGTLSAPIRRDAGWTYFELFAQAYFGNSGGPVVDLKTGKLVGVMQSILGDGRSKSYCIPFGEAQRALDTLPTEKDKEAIATRIASGRHYLDLIAERMPEVEKNADLAMDAQLSHLLNGGADTTIGVTTADGKYVRMSLAELMTELKEKHTATFNNIEKAKAAVSASSEIPSSLKTLLSERIEACRQMRALANSRTNLESTFRKEMNARKNSSDSKAKSFKLAYAKFLDDLERKPVEK